MKEAPIEANQTVHFVANYAKDAAKLQESPNTATSKEGQSKTSASATKLGLVLSVATTGIFLNSNVRALAVNSIGIEGESDIAAENATVSNSSEIADRDSNILEEGISSFRLPKLAQSSNNREIRDAESLWRLPNKYQIQLGSKPRTLLSSSKFSHDRLTANTPDRSETKLTLQQEQNSARIFALKTLEQGKEQQQAVDSLRQEETELSTKINSATNDRAAENLSKLLLLEKHTAQQERALAPSPKVDNENAAEDSVAKLKNSTFTEAAIELDRPVLLTDLSTKAEFLPTSSPAKDEGIQPTPTSVKQSDRELSQPLVLSVAKNPSYQVRSGDTINTIANNYGISPKELLKANKITNPKLLKANQKIEIPGTYVAAANSSQEKIVTAKMPKIEVGLANPQVFPSTPVALDTTVERSSKVELAIANTSSKEIDSQAQVEVNSIYVEKLKADVDRLQEEYHDDRDLGVERTTDSSSPIIVSEDGFASSPKLSLDRKETPTLYADSRINKTKSAEPELEIEIEDKTQPQQSDQSDDNVATAPDDIDTNNYNPALETPVGKPVSPSLPPLSSPDRYLPDIPATFNGYIWPAKGVLTSGYGWRWGRMHKGIDIGAAVGTPVFASASGEVISAGWNSGGYGNLVKVKHANGSITFYAHNSKVLVRAGQIVEQGQQIAALGNTGRSTGPHLHFEVRPDGQKAANPIAFLPKKGS